MIEEATQFISDRLAKQVFGISEAYKKIVVNALQDDPSALRDRNLLHGFIKNLAPRAYDPHLSTSVIKPLYIRFPGLPQAVTKYLAGLQQPSPSILCQQPAWNPQTSSWVYPPTTPTMVYDQYGRPTTQPMPQPPIKQRMTITVDGQKVETDYEGYLAHQRWKREQAEEKRNQQEHELRMKRLEAEILKITGETGGFRTPQGSYEEVREFIDAEGNLCDPEKAVSVRIKRMPIQTKEGLTSEEVRKIMREESEQLTPEKVREIIKSEGKEKPLTSEGVEAIVRKVTAEEKEKLTPERVRDIVKSELRVPPPGTMTAEGVLATAIQEAGRAVGHREPVKIIIEGAKDILVPPVVSAIPPSEMAGSSERGGVIQELRKHGLVTQVVERVRD